MANDMRLDPFATKRPGVYGDLLPSEVWWRDHYTWFMERGYRLRPRYRPGWVKPWTSSVEARRHIDAVPTTYIMDAVKISDGTFVAIKRFRAHDNPDEEAIHRLLGMGDLAQHHRNHSIPLYEVLDAPAEPGLQLLVMPFAGSINRPDWGTVGEAVDCIRQIVEGVAFMHEHHIAHRDCNVDNIMMDITAVFPDFFHPARPQFKYNGKGSPRSCPRSLCRPRYWLIDFGVSRIYPPENGPALDYILAGERRDVPEYKSNPDGLYDPFVVDVFLTGFWIREAFTKEYKQFRFLQALVTDMCAEDPARRPTISQVLERLESVEAKVSIWTLRSRPVPMYEAFWETPWRAFYHWWRQIYYVVTSTPAIPRPVII